jgi:hypothetical protein
MMLPQRAVCALGFFKEELMCHAKIIETRSSETRTGGDLVADAVGFVFSD